MKLANPKKRRTSHARTEVLSVKVSPVEKYMIMMAARKMKISPSEFVRRISMGASRNLGVEEPEITQEPSSPGGGKKAPDVDFDGKAEGEPPIAA